MNGNLRRIVAGSVTMTLVFLTCHAIAAPMPEGVKKPSGAEIDPVEKTVCRHEKRLYEQGTVLEINGKDYICTMNNSWVLAPKQMRKQ